MSLFYRLYPNLLVFHDQYINVQYTFNAQGYQEYIDKFFKHVDENGRRYALDNLANPALRPNLIYEYKGYKPPRNGWAISKEKMEQWDKEGRLHFPSNLGGRIRRKRYLDELKGKPVQSLWDDIEPIGAQAAERLGYPTQKPLALLERIIAAGSNPGDIILDPFCGCGTTVAAAQKLDRRWIGIDITHLAIALQKYRLQEMFPGLEFSVIGEPTSVYAARQLAQDDRFQFEWWALSLIRARPVGGEAGSKTGKKGADKGIDGVITFVDDNTGKPKRIIVQVKSGKVSSRDIRDLHGTVKRENAAIAILITLEEPTRDMVTEAATAGFYRSPGWNKDYPKTRIVTIEQLLKGTAVNIPPAQMTFKQAQRVKESGPQQRSLFDQ